MQQFKYKTQELIERGIDFSVIFPEKQKAVQEMTGFDFDFLSIVAFLRIATDNFTKQNLVALDIDSEIFATYKVWESKQPAAPKPKPKPEPKPVPEPELVVVVPEIKPEPTTIPEEPKKQSKELLEVRLKNLKKRYSKSPDEVMLKLRIRNVEKMLSQPERFCGGGPMVMTEKFCGGGPMVMAEGGKASGKVYEVFIDRGEELGTETIADFVTEKEAKDFMYEYNLKNPDKLNIDTLTSDFYSAGGEVQSELKRLNEELAMAERGTPERFKLLGEIGALKHKHGLTTRRFDGGGKVEKYHIDLLERFIDGELLDRKEQGEIINLVGSANKKEAEKVLKSLKSKQYEFQDIGILEPLFLNRMMQFDPSPNLFKNANKLWVKSTEEQREKALAKYTKDWNPIATSVPKMPWRSLAFGWQRDIAAGVHNDQIEGKEIPLKK